MMQIPTQQPKEGFKKRNQGRFMYDNKSDEMMCNVLQLYPNKKQNIFVGKEGEERRKQLYKNVRDKFNSFAESDYEFVDFGRGKGRLKKAFKGIGKGLKKVGRAVKTAALAPARGSFLTLVRLNFRGLASKFNLLNEKGEKKLFDKWEKLGGKKDALQRAIDKGKSKKVMACGKKCRAKAGENPQLPPDSQSDFVNFCAEPATCSAAIAAAATVTATIVKSIGDKSNYKSQIELAKIENDTQKAEEKEKKIDASMTPQEAAIADEIIKAQAGGFDAVKAIMENPNLTAEEKNAALQDLKEDMVDGGLSTGKKIGIAVGIVALLGIGFYLMNKNKN